MSRSSAIALWMCANSLAGCGYFEFATATDARIEPVADAASDAGSGDGGSDAGTDAAPDAAVVTSGFATLCAYTAITVFDDGDPNDVAAGATLAAGVASGCASSPTITTRLETSPGLLDPTTKAPLLGAGTLGAVGGDAYYQDVMAYLEQNTTPLVATETPSAWTIAIRGGAQLVSRPIGTLDGSHDVTVIEISRDAPSGSVVLTAYGLYFQGTLAAAYYFAHTIVPTIGTDGHDYYVVEWTDGDGGQMPDAADTFSVLAMGP